MSDKFGKKYDHFSLITETSPYAIGNFRKLLLYKCFMSLSSIVYIYIQTNIKFLRPSLKKIVCLQLPTWVFKEWIGRSGIFFFFF